MKKINSKDYLLFIMLLLLVFLITLIGTKEAKGQCYKYGGAIICEADRIFVRDSTSVLISLEYYPEYKTYIVGIYIINNINILEVDFYFGNTIIPLSAKHIITIPDKENRLFRKELDQDLLITRLSNIVLYTDKEQIQLFPEKDLIIRRYNSIRLIDKEK